MRPATSLQSFGNGMFVQAHGFCQDRDGNFWAGDSGPFADSPATAGPRVPGVQVQPGRQGAAVRSARPACRRPASDTFIGPTACAIAPNGDIIDRRRPLAAADRLRSRTAIGLVRITTDGKFVAEYGKLGTAPGEFMGPHALAFDSQGRLFVADRSNNRVQVFDQAT